MLGLKLIHVSKKGYRQQAITLANADPDLCCYTVSLGHDELTKYSRNPL